MRIPAGFAALKRPVTGWATCRFVFMIGLKKALDPYFSIHHVVQYPLEHFT